MNWTLCKGCLTIEFCGHLRYNRYIPLYNHGKNCPCVKCLIKTVCKEECPLYRKHYGAIYERILENGLDSM